MTELPDPARFAHVTDWVFDLDNTLYPHHTNLFSQIDQKMTAYVSELLTLPREEARKLQKELYLEYGTTLSGLMQRQFIFTNGDRGHAERTARQLGILDHFDDIFDIVAAGLTPKPAQQTYDKFLELHQIAGRNAVMFEDLARNLIVPKALGMLTVLIVPKNFEPTFSEIWERDPAFDDAVDFVTDDLASFLNTLIQDPKA
jgi:putative hydrolase of the HAD superfamily